VAAQVCASRSVTLFRKGEYQEGIQSGKQALKLAKRSREEVDIAYAHNMLANSYIETGQLRKSIDHLRQAVEHYHRLDDYPGIAAANSNLASCYGFFGDLEESIKHFNVALKADERMQNDSSLAIDHQNLGHVLALRGRIDEAIEHLQQVVDMDEQGRCRPDLAGAAYIDLCQCKLDIGAKDEAETLLEKGLELLKQSGQTGLIMDAELQLAELRLEQGRLQQAHELCIDILQRTRKLDAKLYEVRGERVLGIALGELGKVDEAKTHLKQSVQIARQIGADHEKARSLVALARLGLEKGADSTAASLKKLKQALEIFSDMGAALELERAQQLYESYL
jgi:tetratricopeptide (TPR) repeat protein